MQQIEICICPPHDVRPERERCVCLCIAVKALQIRKKLSKKKVIKRKMLHVCKCVCLFVSNAEIVIGFQFGRICSSLQSQLQVSAGGEFIIMPLVCLAASGGGGCPSCRRRCKSFEGGRASADRQAVYRGSSLPGGCGTATRKWKCVKNNPGASKVRKHGRPAGKWSHNCGKGC